MIIILEVQKKSTDPKGQNTYSYNLDGCDMIFKTKGIFERRYHYEVETDLKM